MNELQPIQKLNITLTKLWKSFSKLQFPNVLQIQVFAFTDVDTKTYRTPSIIKSS